MHQHHRTSFVLGRRRRLLPAKPCRFILSTACSWLAVPDVPRETLAAVGTLAPRRPAGKTLSRSFVASTAGFFAVFSGMALPEKPQTLAGVWGSFPRGNAVAGVAKPWTMLPMASGGLAARRPGRFHVETARLKIFSQALRAFPRGNGISDNYALY
jgi:hypothetical protein